MDRALRQAFNAAYTDDFYRRYLDRFTARLGAAAAFRVAETPLFLPLALRRRLAKHAREIVAQISRPELIAKLESVVPPHLSVPRRDALSSCIQVDFAIVDDGQGGLDGRLVELQGFPSLYALMVVQTEVLAEEMRAMPGLDREWSLFYGGHTRDSYVRKLRRALVANEDPREVVLLDLDPKSQKTYVDFLATKELVGIDAIAPHELEVEGRHLYRRVGGERVRVKRIFNRVVFDELENKGERLPFAYTDDIDVHWVPHPNWYWIWSKYTVPSLDHPAVPRARFVDEITEVPADLGKYVLKPLFSFGGAGVIVDVTKHDLESIPEKQRHGWILQEKIEYAPALRKPDGAGVKAEVRMMFLREDGEETPELVMNLVRLSRGKMLGVDQNKTVDWQGGTVGIWPADEESPLGPTPMSAPLDCQACGACCTNPDENRAEGFTSYVEVPASSPLLARDDRRKRYVVRDADGVPHLRLDPSGRCAALLGPLGRRVRCAIYADRPRGCRLVEAGSPRCLQARRERGIS